MQRHTQSDPAPKPCASTPKPFSPKKLADNVSHALGIEKDKPGGDATDNKDN